MDPSTLFVLNTSWANLLEAAEQRLSASADLPLLLIQTAADQHAGSATPIADDVNFQRLVLSRLRDLIALRTETSPTTPNMLRSAIAQSVPLPSSGSTAMLPSLRLWLQSAVEIRNRSVSFDDWCLHLRDAITAWFQSQPKVQNFPGFELFRNVKPWTPDQAEALSSSMSQRTLPSSTALLTEIYQAMQEAAILQIVARRIEPRVAGCVRGSPPAR